MKYKVYLDLDTTLREVHDLGFRRQHGGAYIFNQDIGDAFVTISHNYELGVTPGKYFKVIANKMLKTGKFYKMEVEK